MTFEEQIGGAPDSYIKLKEVQQNSTGDQFAIAYLDDGKFRLRTFGQETRTLAEIKKEELDINPKINIDDYTMPINNFPDPYITTCFVNDGLLFVNLFYNATLTHHHFFFNRETREISQHHTIQIDCNGKNFPFNCFYNEEFNEVYSFYRQG